MPPAYNGVVIRAAVIYVAWAMLAWRAELLIPFAVAVLVVEGALYLVYRRAAAQTGQRGRHLVGWLSAGETVFGLGGLGAALLSSSFQAGLIGVVVLAWCVAVAVQAILSRAGKTRTGGLSKPLQKKLAFAVEIVLFSALAGVGLVVCIIAFVLDRTDLVPAGLALGFAGLACGFSAQLRALLGAMT